MTTPTPATSSQAAATPAITIVGGGIGGVILAIGLMQRGVSFHIYEAAADFGEIGAGVSCGSNAVHHLGLISPKLLEAFNRHATCDDGEDKSVFSTLRRLETTPDGEAGERLFVVRGGPRARGEDGPPTRSCVHRALFLNEIIRLLPKGSTTFKKSLVTIEEPAGGADGPIILHFADGTTAPATAVVGCDGIKSPTRRYLHGPGAVPVYTGSVAYRALVPRQQCIDVLGWERALNGQLAVGRSGYLVTYPVANGKFVNMVAALNVPESDWPHKEWQIPCTTDDVRADLQGWDPKLLDLMVRFVSGPSKWALFDNMHSNPYTRGRICLLGDSAHAATPHLGAGASMAIEDAYVLSRLLTPGQPLHEIEKAFSLYDSIRRPRSQQLVRLSRQNATEGLFLSPSDDEDIAKMQRDITKRFHWVWDGDMQGQVMQATEEHTLNTS